MQSNNEFEYTGKGCVVPKDDVTIVRFHLSVVEVEMTICVLYVSDY